MDKVALSLAKTECLDMKEFSESVEFFTHVRSRWRKVIKTTPEATVIVDLCCGHGFTGMLFAIFERSCQKVILCDRSRPKSFSKILAAVLAVAPWVKPKLDLHLFGEDADGSGRDDEKKQQQKHHYGDLLTLQKDPSKHLPKGATILAVHACGGATDLSMHIGIALESSCLFLLPCCYRAADMSVRNKLYTKRFVQGSYEKNWSERRPMEIEARLGRGLSSDVDRTYLLHEEGYEVVWAVLPPEVTPMNRVIVAWRVRPQGVVRKKVKKRKGTRQRRE